MEVQHLPNNKSIMIQEWYMGTCILSTQKTETGGSMKVKEFTLGYINKKNTTENPIPTVNKQYKGRSN